MFDTHCHLNFSVFKKIVDQVIQEAKTAGIDKILIPGTDIDSSKRAIKIAQRHDGVYAAVGIHPHHLFEVYKNNNHNYLDLINDLKNLITNEKVLAVGEVGLDKHCYQQTKYKDYGVGPRFIDLQKTAFEKQIDLAIEYDKSLIVHNREAKIDLLKILNDKWDKKLKGKVVFHCCEADIELLDFALEHDMYMGVDGDVTFNEEKKEFVKQIPLKNLVLETDSPFLLPEPLRSKKLYPNKPKNITVITEFIGKLINKSTREIAEATLINAYRLFNLDKN